MKMHYMICPLESQLRFELQKKTFTLTGKVVRKVYEQGWVSWHIGSPAEAEALLAMLIRLRNGKEKKREVPQW